MALQCSTHNNLAISSIFNEIQVAVLWQVTYGSSQAHAV